MANVANSLLGRELGIQLMFSRLDLEAQEEGKVRENNEVGPPRDISYSSAPSGGIWRVLAIGVNDFVSASYDRTAKLWKGEPTAHGFEFGDVKVICSSQREILSVARYSDDVFMTGSSDGRLSFWNVADGSLQGSLRERSVMGFYSLAPLDLTRVATGACDRPKHHRGPWNALIKIWDVASGGMQACLTGHQGGVSALINIDGQRLASASADKTIRIWNVADGQALRILKKHTDYVYGLAKLGSSLVSGSKDRTIKLVDIETGKTVRCFQDRQGVGHASTVYDVNTWGLNTMVSASRDGYVKLWDDRVEGSAKQMDVGDGFVYAANFTPDGKVIIGTSGQAAAAEDDQPKKARQKIPKQNAHVAVWDVRA